MYAANHNHRCKLTLTESGVGIPETAAPVALSPEQPNHPTRFTRTAEAMVIACGLNVEFLNRHLAPFSQYLELPPLTDNALYLAYTIRIRKDAPFEAVALRRHLATRGIETRADFSFYAHPDVSLQAPSSRLPVTETPRTFCLPCHRTVSLLDLKKIICGFQTFFASLAETPDTKASHE